MFIDVEELAQVIEERFLLPSNEYWDTQMERIDRYLSEYLNERLRSTEANVDSVGNLAPTYRH